MPPTLPPERYALFLWVRRGLPLVAAFFAFLFASLDPAHRGWWILGCVTALTLVGTTFQRGDSYLRARASLVRWDGRWVRFFRPLARLAGREDAWILSFCGFHNARVREAFETTKARKALILLPHCIQLAKCKAPVLTDLTSCYECGLCPVEDFLHATLENRWESRITNRSHKAYREARAYRPDLIVAVSCTDRLLKGVVKVAEVPAYVLPLALPHGMCVDTQFSVPLLAAAMEALVEPKPRLEPLAHEASA